MHAQTLLALTALLAIAPLAPLAAAAEEAPPDPDHFTLCTPLATARVCVSRDNTWYCYWGHVVRMPLAGECFQFVGP